jgi:DoxX-like family
MAITIKILNTALILFAVFMGLKQGGAMLSGKPAMTDMFAKWNIGKTGVMVLGAFTLLGAILILFPKTFIWGNFIMAAGILFIIVLHLTDKDMQGVLVELPFFLLSLVIIYLQYPLPLKENAI